MDIYDNISGDNLAAAIKSTLKGAKGADFCIGYFNPRGWDLPLESVDALPGGQTDERFEDDTSYKACVLMGMQKRPQEDLEDYYALRKKEISNEKAVKPKLETRFQNRWDDQYSVDITNDPARIKGCIKNSAILYLPLTRKKTSPRLT
jgi:hypothetical protein